MFGRVIERILDLLFEKHEIGRAGLSRYLTRWVLYGRRSEKDGTRRNGPGPKVFLHWFHRGDAEPYDHDHPWPFWSLILWGGYYEWVECKTKREVAEAFAAGELVREGQDRVGGENVILRPPVFRRRWYGMLSLLRRPAEWHHHVTLPPGRKCWTLIWTGTKVRSWGFYCANGFVPWRQYMANQEAGGSGCGEE